MCRTQANRRKQRQPDAQIRNHGIDPCPLRGVAITIVNKENDMPRVSATSECLDKYHTSGGDLEITSCIDLCRKCWSAVDGWTMPRFKDECWNPSSRWNGYETREPWQSGVLYTVSGGGEAAPLYEDEDYQCELCNEELGRCDN